MARSFTAVVVLLLAVAGWTQPTAAQSKVELCHRPPGNPDHFMTITVNRNAVRSHLNHGDKLGRCDDNCDYLCDDGDACTIDDLGNCENNGCPSQREQVSCDDGLACTVNSCVPATGCVFQPVECGPDEQCLEPSGECQPSEVVYGHPEDLGSNSSHQPNFLLGNPVSVDVPGSLLRFGVLNVLAGVNAKFAVYADEDGVPTTLMAMTAATSLVEGAQEIVFTSNPSIPAGTYWLMAVFEETASVRYSITASETVKYASYPFGNSLPEQFPPSTTYFGQAFNYWVVVGP